MKVKITEDQHKLLTETRKRAYSFDWDDNILMMPTQIHLERKIGNGEWVPVDVSTSEFAELRHQIGKGYKFLGGNPEEAFADFRDYDAFQRDTELAIKRKSFGPSFDKFKEALIYGNDFSIITARGNSPKALRDGTRLLINLSFSDEELSTMEDNLKGTSISEYLSLQDYHPVTSEEFQEEFGNEGGAENPEIAKTIALKDFVRRVVETANHLQVHPEHNGLSVGFSDDDLGNIEKAEEFIREELQKVYPDVKFLVYDTSDPNDTKKKRIVIKK